MLESYYDCQRVIWRLKNCGTFGDCIEEFTEHLHDKQFSKPTVREYVRAAAHLSRFALWEGVTELSGLDEQFVCRFVNEHLPNCSCERVNRGKYTSTIQGVWHVLRYLAERGLVPLPASLIENSMEPKRLAKNRNKAQQKKSNEATTPSSISEDSTPRPPRTDVVSQEVIMKSLPESMGGLILQYDEYLTGMFGLTKKTRDVHRLKTMLFLKWIYEKHGESFQLSNLCADDIIHFQEMCNEYGFSNDYRKTITGCLRGFLRFLRWERILEVDLCPAVYRVKEWKLASVPKFIPFESAELLLSVPDRKTIKGKRDYLALLLLLKLGLRASEVILMELGDISLVEGKILIKQTKSSKERVLPITNEIAEAFAEYLLDRPADLTQNRLILRSVRPFTPLVNASALGGVVRQCIHEVGIKAPSFGTHLLRHTLATHMINNGASYKDVADILGHKSIETTGIYAKVQIERLKCIAMPFPNVEEVCAR